MIGALKQMEAGRNAEDVAREVGVSKHTIYASRRVTRVLSPDRSQVNVYKSLSIRR